MDNNILVQNLCKQFEGFSLDNVSFKVPKGRIVGFIGENGAGKSTTINLILNELNKDSGQIQVFGIDHTIPTVKENIGVVFDECNFHDVFTAADIEKILKGVYKTWDSNLFSQYLKKFKIPTKKTISAFSKGMFYFVKYFEDGPGMAAMVNSIYSYVLITGIAAILIFGISLIISTIGYSRKN